MRRRRFDQINVVPFVDIVLVLLVIVLATSTFVRQGRLPVHLPKGHSTAPLLHTPTVITLKADGSYALNDRPICWEDLQASINKMETNATLLLRTDAHTPFLYFSRLLSQLKSRPITRVSIATEAPKNAAR